MSIKSDLLEKIKKKVKRKEALSEEIAQRTNNVEAFIMKMLDELDADMASMAAGGELDSPEFRDFYIGGVEQRLKAVDSGVKIEVSWSADHAPGVTPRINGILVKWSSEYQKAHDCEPELFVDVFSLLLA